VWEPPAGDPSPRCQGHGGSGESERSSTEGKAKEGECSQPCKPRSSRFGPGSGAEPADPGAPWRRPAPAPVRRRWARARPAWTVRCARAAALQNHRRIVCVCFGEMALRMESHACSFGCDGIPATRCSQRLTGQDDQAHLAIAG
jgi:hypothetical protein